MHPIERTSQRRSSLRETVATGDVREFVSQNGATHLERPGIGRTWHDDRRLPDANGHWRRSILATEKSDVTANAEFFGTFAEKLQPIRIDEFLRMTHEAPDRESIDEHTNGQQNHTDGIDDK